ncbi:MAG TPA: S41 family peptidase [Chitinophagaceae bacterium]|nr:S41 family peptidase [Chitinophagaceae bacterium]
MNFNRILFTGLLISLVLFTVPLSAQERSPVVANQLALLDTIYTRIARSYVEEPPQEQLLRKGIDASLSALDPYSNYMNKEEAEDFMFGLSAKFGGIGLVMGTMNKNTIYIKEIFKGYPADRTGIKPGDVLLQIDTVSLKDKTIEQAFPLLRGKPGTAVSVRLFRPSTKESFTINTNREEVLLPSVPYHGVLANDIGYIKITGETAQTGDEVRNALMEIKRNPKLKGLVLDLRGNIGGAMNQAIKVANLFLSKGLVAVSVKSWRTDTIAYLKEEPIDTQLPMVLLIDKETASAGEIIAGALQDHDRAILIGEKSFGKGMVQRLYNLPDGQLLKLTTEYYFTPSGRCIQRKEKGGQRTEQWTDSAKKTVFTLNGRPVISYDGIAPDISMKIAAVPPVIQDLERWPNSELFRFANQYYITHKKIAPAVEFRISDDDYNHFISFLKKENFSLTGSGELKLDQLEKTLELEGYNVETQTALEKLRALIKSDKERQYIKYKNEIKSLLEGEIAVQYYYNQGRVANVLKDDEVLAKALEVLGNWEKYKGVLTKK